MKLDLTPTSKLSDEERRELRELNILVNGPPETRREAMLLTWSGIEDTVCAVRIRLNGQLVSSLFMAERSIMVGGRHTQAAGIRGVLTHPEYRRRGFGRAAMQRATNFMWQDLQAELGLLLSSEMAVPFYKSLGWEVVNGPVLCEQPSGTINYTELMPQTPAMVLIPPEGKLSITSIDMCGLPW